MALQGPSGANQSSRKVYDDTLAASVAADIPDGAAQGRFLVKDPATLTQATDSQRFAGFVFMGNEVLESDDPRGI